MNIQPGNYQSGGPSNKITKQTNGKGGQTQIVHDSSAKHIHMDVYGQGDNDVLKLHGPMSDWKVHHFGDTTVYSQKGKGGDVVVAEGFGKVKFMTGDKKK